MESKLSGVRAIVTKVHMANIEHRPLHVYHVYTMCMYLSERSMELWLKVSKSYGVLNDGY